MPSKEVNGGRVREDRRAVTVEVHDKRDELRAICQRLRVRRLELFGSGANGKFQPDHSDLDFLVEFEDMPPAEYADAYFALLKEVTTLYGRRIDLVTTASLKNPFFIENVQQSRTLIYAP